MPQGREIYLPDGKRIVGLTEMIPNFIGTYETNGAVSGSFSHGLPALRNETFLFAIAAVDTGSAPSAPIPPFMQISGSNITFDYEVSGLPSPAPGERYHVIVWGYG